MKTFSRLKISSTSPKFLFFKSLCCKLPFPMGHSTLNITSHLYCQNQQVHESSEEAGLVAPPGPPGSMSEPSCSRTVRKRPPELLLFLRDLTPLQLSFVLGAGADLPHSWGPGASIRASHHRVLHTTWSLLSSGTSTRCCCLPHWFPMGCVQAGVIITLGSAMLPLGPRAEFPTRACGLVLLSLAGIPLLDSTSSPPAALQRLMLELAVIFLARSVILSSSHSTFQSILGTTAAHLGQLCPRGGPSPQGLC